MVEHAKSIFQKSNINQRSDIEDTIEQVGGGTVESERLPAAFDVCK